MADTLALQSSLNSIAGTSGLAAQGAASAIAAAVAAYNGGKGVNTIAASGTAATIVAPSVANFTRITLTNTPCVLTFPAAVAGAEINIAATQDATGSRLITWPASVKWPAGTAPTLSTVAGKTDVVRFISFDGATWLGVVTAIDVR
jgi:hypothetical protein